MKKFWFFSLIFIILGTVVFGEDFNWTGGGNNWASHTNWNNQPELADPATDQHNFPGKDGRTTDSVFIDGNVPGGTINIANFNDTTRFIGSVLNLNTLRIGVAVPLRFDNWTLPILDTIEVGELILNGNLQVRNNIDDQSGGGPIDTAFINIGKLTVGTAGQFNVNTANGFSASLYMDGAPLTVTTTDITISPTGDVVIGDINAPGRVITINSSGGKIDINGNINGTRLVINATNSDVTIAGTVIVSSNGEGTNAAVYVDAKSFTVSGSIKPGDTGYVCVYNVTSHSIGNNTVEGNRYHIHSLMDYDGDAHLIYGTQLPPPPFDPSWPYVFIDSGDNTLSTTGTFLTINAGEITASVNAPYNVYIVDVGNSAPTRNVTLNVAGAGFIEIHGDYTSSGALVLNSGTGGIRLVDANINSGTNFNTNNSSLILTGTNNRIAATNITINGAAGSGALTLDGASTLSANITTTGDQIYNGAVTLTGAVNFTGNAGSTVRFGNTVNGAYSLTVTGANAVFNGIVGGLTSIDVTAGTTAINANITTTGNQNYGTGNVTLNNGTRTLTGGSVTAGGVVTGTGLTINAGGVIDLQNNNNVPTVSLTGAGAITYNSNLGTGNNLAITTTNNATGTTTITERTGNLTANNVRNGTVILSAVNITIAAGADTVNCYSLVLDAGTTGSVNINGTITAANPTNVDHNAPNHYEDAAVYISTGSFAGTGAINLAGTGWVCAYVNEVITYTGTVTGNRIYYHISDGTHIVYSTGTRPATIDGVTPPFLYIQAEAIQGANLELSTTGTGNIYVINIPAGSGIANTREVNFSTGANGIIEIRGAYNSSGALNLSPGTGGITLNNANINTGAAFNITNSSFVLANGTTNNINAAVTLDADVNFTGNAVIQFGNTVNGGRALTVTNANAVFNGAVGGITSLTTINITAGTAAINAGITTSGNQTYNGAVTLTNDVNFTGNAGSIIRFGSTVNGGRALTVTNANAVFNGIVGPLTGINVTAGTASISADITTTTGGQIYSGAVTLTDAVNFTGNAGSTVQFGNTVNGTSSLTVTNANIQFDDDVTTTGNQNYGTGTVTLTGARTFAGGSVTAGGAINGTGITVNANQGISLTGNNNVPTVNLTGSGAITYNSNLGTGNNLAITTTNNATGTTTITERTGNLTANNVRNGTVILSAVNITIAAGADTVNCYSLVLDAGTTGSVNINGTITAASPYGEYHDERDAVFINAGNITGTGNIVLNSTTGWVCAFIDNDVTYTGSVTGSRIHYHSNVNRHIVYTTLSRVAIINIPGPYLYIQANGIQGMDLELSTTGTGNIYIIDIPSGSGGDANTRDVSFTTAPDGIIEIRGIYYSSGVLVLAPGTGGIRLNDANIELTAVSFNTTASLTLNGTTASSIRTAVNITLNNVIINTGGVQQNFTLEAINITLNGTIGALAARLGNITVVNGNIVFSAAVYAASYTQQAGSAVINALQNYTGSFSFTGVNLTTNATLNTESVGVTINNSGTFTQNAGISTAGIFTQTTGAGNSVLSANITTANNIINFAGSVRLNGTVELNSGTGNITFISTSAITGTTNLTDNLTLRAGAGSVTVSGDMGTGALFLGNIDITGTVVTTQNVFANGIIIRTGPLTLDNVTYTVPDAGGTVRLPPVVNLSNTTLKLAGGIEASPMLLGRTGTSITINGDITISANSYVRLENATSVTQATTGRKLTLTEGTTTLDTSAGSWHIGAVGASNAFTGNNGDLVLGGSSRLIANNLDLTSNSFTVNNSGWAYIGVRDIAEITIVNLGNDFPRLIIEMRGNDAQTPQTLITTRQLGSLHVKTGSRTNLGNVSHNSLNNNLGICGEVVIEWPGFLYAGNNDITMYAGIAETNYPYNDGKGSVTIPNARVGRWENINAPEYITGGNPNNMHAFQQSTARKVEFKSDSPPLISGQNVFFEIIGNTVWQSFICENTDINVDIKLLFSTHEENLNQHHHVFLNHFKMIGLEKNAVTQEKNLLLTRYVPPGKAWSAWYQEYDRSPDPPSVADIYPYQQPQGIPISPAPRYLQNESINERIKFWNFNLVSPSPPDPHHAQMEIFHITVFFSHAWSQRIPISTNEMKVNIVPYYRRSEPIKGHFCYNWIEVRKIIYSFVEDANGNGKVDRIRVQTNVPLNGIFTGFGVDVEGYNAIGFDTVENVLASQLYPTEPEDSNSFYIFLEETPYLYDGQPVKWWVTRNDNSLLDGITNQLLVGEPDSGEEYFTINTIPPRVSYALTLPGHNQTYIQMSQPVSSFGKNVQITGPMVRLMSNHLERALNIVPTPSYSHILEYFPYGAPAPEAFYNDLIDAPPPEGVLSYLLELNSAPDVLNLAGFPSIGVDPGDWHFVMENLFNMGVRALDWNDAEIDESSFLYYPSPRYPVDWNYTGYRSFKGNSHVRGLTEDDDVFNPDLTEIFLPPYQVLTPEMTSRLARYAARETDDKVIPTDFDVVGDNQKRRITDVLISREPTGTDSENYFAWPVWARYKDESRHTGFQWDDSFWGQMDTDDGIIWVFNGTKFLQERDIILQVRINNGKLNGYNSLSLFYGFNVPAEWRNPEEEGLRGRSSGGLWLPRISNPLFNIVPTGLMYTNDLMFTNPGNFNGNLGFYPFHVRDNGIQNAPLFTFDLIKEKFSSGGKIDFFLRFEGNSADPNLFIARLDAPAGSIPNNWYQLVRPFSFDLQNVRLQRGGVTIRNNVINSDNREITYISYYLVRPGRVTIQVYTLEGTLVKSLRRNEQREAGEWTEPWDGTNNAGRPVARGIYFIRIVAPDIDEIRKVMVIK